MTTHNPQEIDMQQLQPASSWILSRYIALVQELEKHETDYELAHSVQALYSFLWDDVADWYIEYLKADDTDIAFAKELFEQFCITLHPYMPFETEALWKEFFEHDTLLAQTVRDDTWFTHYTISSQDNETFEQVIDIIRTIRSLRGLFAIDPATPVNLYSKSPLLIDYKAFIATTTKSLLQETMPDNLYTITTPFYSYALDIKGIIQDIPAEITRSKKMITDLDRQITQMESQLSNEGFLAHAETEVVEQKRKDLADRSLERTQQEEKIAFLES